jgi:CBS domain containing-hemolysin-like protein
MVLFSPLNIADKLFRPIVTVLNKFSQFLIKLFGLGPQDENANLFTPDDLEFIVGESLESGLLERTDQLFIENILDLDERTAGQIMTPRNRIQAFSVETSPMEVIEKICATNRTRYPVFDSTLDHILGVLHIKDLARWQVNHPGEQPDLSKLLRPLVYIPEALPLKDLLYKFRDEHTQIAIALDEFGGTSGVITLEDLIEEVVGEILDEFDQELVPFKKIRPNTIRVRGDILLGELEQHFKINFDEEIEANSIGGYIMSQLGTIPSPSDTLTVSGIRITVESVEKFAVKTVVLEFPPDRRLDEDNLN